MGKPLVWTMVDGRLELAPGRIKKVPVLKWANPRRQALLVQLFEMSQGFCVYGHKMCSGKWIEHKGQACNVIGGGCSEPQAHALCRFQVDPTVPRQPCDYRRWTTLTWQCHYGHDSCEAPFASHYETFVSELIRLWQADAREQARLERKLERRVDTGETGRLRGDWNETSRDGFYAEQPESYIEALGMSGVSFTPFAKVRLPSSMVNLHVDLGDSLRKLSKHKRRKVVRYGKPLPENVQNRIEWLVSRAVRRFWDKGA